MPTTFFFSAVNHQMNVRETLEQALRAKRDFSTSTMRTYVSLLASLLKRIGSDNIEELQKSDEVIRIVNEQIESPQTKKTLFSALFLLTTDDKYNQAMRNNIVIVNDHYKKRKLDDKRKSVDLSFDQIKEINRRFVDAYKQNPKDLDRLQTLLISMLCSGEFQPPRRLLDYAAMRLKNVDKKSDNYVQGKSFIFNKYKTARLYGTQTVAIHPEVLRLILKLRRLDPTREYLLQNSKGGPMSTSSLHKKLKTMYGFGIDMLRSVFLTDEVYSDGLLTRLENLAEDMGHSVDAAKSFYVKDKTV